MWSSAAASHSKLHVLSSETLFVISWVFLGLLLQSGHPPQICNINNLLSQRAIQLTG